MSNILEMRGISKSFPGVMALDHASLSVEEGEIHALIGENGAGKSTLMKVLLGLYEKDAGEIFFGGKQVEFKSPHDALGMGISMIHQEITLVQSLSVAENIWLGHESRFATYGVLNSKARAEATAELLKEVGLDIDPGTIVKTLSIAQMQLIELARAMSYDSRLIIMDEPTSSLTEKEINLLFENIRRLSSKGVAVIFISHKIEEIFSICRRVTVMRDGKTVGVRFCNEIDYDQLITLIVGRELNNLFPKEDAEIKDVVLEVKNLTSIGVFDNISFNVKAGEILGFCGLVGAGRTEIMRAVFGIDHFDSGEVLINGEQVKISSPTQAIGHGLAMVTEDRLRLGSIHKLSVKENINVVKLKSLCNKLGIVDDSSFNSTAEEMVERLSIKTSGINQRMGELSGGNQQKVIIGRWLTMNPKVLILDEPTRGIDVGAKAEIHRLVSKLAQQGVAVILVSSEMPEILGMSDRVIVVRDGSIVFECQTKEATQEILIAHAFGNK